MKSLVTASCIRVYIVETAQVTHRSGDWRDEHIAGTVVRYLLKEGGSEG